MSMEASELERKVGQHDETINKDILPRLEKLESVTSEFQEKVGTLTNDVVRVQSGQADLAKGQKELELTVVKEGQANRSVIEQTRKSFEKLLDHFINRDNQDHQSETQMAQRKADAEEKKAASDAQIRSQRWELAGKLLTVLFGGGGLIALIVQYFLNN